MKHRDQKAAARQLIAAEMRLAFLRQSQDKPMNDTPKPAAALTIKEPINAGGPIAGLVPQNIEQAFRLAQALAQAGDMIPKAFQGNPNAIMAAMIKGAEIGLAPMQALANIAVINGRASLWGDAIPALVQRAGHHLDVEVEGDGDDMVAAATLTRSDGRKVVRCFSMKDAKRAGLVGKPGPWQQYPQRMVAMRARAWAARDGAADALMGFQIAEEVEDYGPDTARDVTPAAPRRGGVMYREPAQPPSPVDDFVEHLTATDTGPTAEDLARAEAEALAAIAAQNKEGGE